MKTIEMFRHHNRVKLLQFLREKYRVSHQAFGAIAYSSTAKDAQLSLKSSKKEQEARNFNFEC